MIRCPNCGAQISDGVNYCPNCGAPIEHDYSQKRHNYFQDAMDGMGSGEDWTPDFDPADIHHNKAMALLSYLGILVFIPILARRNSPYTRFHANQGLTLFFCEVLINAVIAALRFLRRFSIFWGLGSLIAVFRILSLVCVVFAILGIIYVCNGTARKLPFIGKFRFLK